MNSTVFNTTINRLRDAVEQKAGRKIRTPRDFDYLHDCIFSECHDMVSVSTLKRIWGYVATDGQPRIASLDLLAHYVGFRDWDHFAEQHGRDGNLQTDAQHQPEEPGQAEEDSLTEGTHQPEEPGQAIPSRRRIATRWLAVIVPALIIVVAGYFLMVKTGSSPAGSPRSGQRVLHKGGDTFRTPDQYLSLFGIEGGDTAYFRPVPGLDNVYVWGPEYRHPVWHNEGDSLQLLPTITEYWLPLPGSAEYESEEYVREVNAKLYYERLVKDELRITFMRDLIDGFYVFLGVYRLDHEQSSTEKCVWRRVAESLDLGRLADLEPLREKSR